MKIAVNSFVKRQTEESRFSHFDGTWDELPSLVELAYYAPHGRPPNSSRDGVMVVNVPANRFYTNLAVLQDGDTLIGRFERRVEGEEPRKVIGLDTWPAERVVFKEAAVDVDIVLYRSDVLHETDQNELPPECTNWEIISINASPFSEKMPINPETLMHNHFGSDGGTDTKMSDSEFVAALRESFICWKDKAQVI